MERRTAGLGTTTAVCIIGAIVIALSGCGTPSAPDKKASPQPAAELWGPERERGTEPARIMGLIDQFQCFANVQRQVTAAVNLGSLDFLDRGYDYRVRWSCVVAAICDQLDGAPNYFWAVQLNLKKMSPEDRAREEKFLETCKGVEEWGPGLIEDEPEVFAIAIAERDRMRGAYRKKVRDIKPLQIETKGRKAPAAAPKSSTAKPAK